jgi:hypothetical protein
VSASERIESDLPTRRVASGPTTAEVTHAEPYRREPVLDRTLHRASDGTTRVLDVHLQLLEDPWIEEDLACRSPSA